MTTDYKMRHRSLEKKNFILNKFYIKKTINCSL
jgi:hypothetical protein